MVVEVVVVAAAVAAGGGVVAVVVADVAAIARGATGSVRAMGSSRT